nr:hypothetical protein [Tanacetum cinerariifolium]
MRTRSQSRNNFAQQEASPAIVEPLRIELPFLEDQFQEDPPVDPPEVPMADNRTMADLFQAPTEGYEDAIVILEITANNFELKYGLINLVQNKQFFRHDKEDPHAHIPRIWLEKEAPRSIQTWDDLVSKFINQFLPPLKTTNLRNEITRFQQRFDKSFYEAWERFNDMLRACPHHGFFELHQLDTFYNALNVNDQDSLNSAAVVAKVSTSLSTPAISSDIAELKDMVKALLLDKKNQSPAPTPSSTPASVKVVEPNCVTCGGAHSYQNCFATNENAYRDNIQEYVSQAATANYNQENTGFQPQMVANQIRPPGVPPHQNNQNNFNRGNNFNQNRGMDECLALADLGTSINLMPFSVWEAHSLSKLTLTCMTLELADRSTGRALIDVHKGELTLRIGNEAITYNLDQTEADAFLGLEDDLDSPKINPFYYYPEGDILLLETILNSEPLAPLPNHE